MREFVSPKIVNSLRRKSVAPPPMEKATPKSHKDSGVAAQIDACKSENDKNGQEETQVLQRFLDEEDPNDSSPTAEKFPETTVMFGDIIGFTIWSKSLQPTQVFRFLEQVYARFDSICEDRGIINVKTIGDAYVAVSGLPEKRDE